MSKQNLLMVDFAKQDVRSVAAMLRGNGDGREKKFIEFMTSEALKDPLVTEEKLHEDFRIQSKAEFHREINQIRNQVGSTWVENSENKPKRTIFGFLKFRNN